MDMLIFYWNNGVSGKYNPNKYCGTTYCTCRIMKRSLIALSLLTTGAATVSAFLVYTAPPTKQVDLLLSRFFVATKGPRSAPSLSATTNAKGKNDNLPEFEKDRLLLSEPALNAFIVAEMRDFVTKAKIDSDLSPSRKWKMKDKDKIALGILNAEGAIIDDTYDENMDGNLAVDLICNATGIAFRDGYNQEGLLSALGSAICYFRDYYRVPKLVAACERIGMSDYAVAHHITDMYHHRSFRGAYTKTLTPSGKGEIAAQLAVGLSVKKDGEGGMNDKDDECILWSPTTPGSCLHWKSDDEAWRKTRFERVQMEGTRDPRRGGSGTSR